MHAAKRSEGRQSERRMHAAERSEGKQSERRMHAAERSEGKQSSDRMHSAERSEGADVPEGRPTVAQRFSAGTAAPTKEPRAVGTPEPPPQTQTPPRKPSASAPQAPKERKIAAQRASAG